MTQSDNQTYVSLINSSDIAVRLSTESKYHQTVLDEDRRRKHLLADASKEIQSLRQQLAEFGERIRILERRPQGNDLNKKTLDVRKQICGICHGSDGDTEVPFFLIAELLELTDQSQRGLAEAQKQAAFAEQNYDRCILAIRQAIMSGESLYQGNDPEDVQAEVGMAIVMHRQLAEAQEVNKNRTEWDRMIADKEGLPVLLQEYWKMHCQMQSGELEIPEDRDAAVELLTGILGASHIKLAEAQAIIDRLRWREDEAYKIIKEAKTKHYPSTTNSTADDWISGYEAALDKGEG